MFSHIRTRLAVAMAVPVAVLVLVAAFEALAADSRLSAAQASGHASAAHAALLHLFLWAFMAVAALVFGAGAVLRVSHSITAPLVRLSSYADDLAEHRLAAAVRAILAGAPAADQLAAPPATEGDDEVASVAHALLAVQERALALAVEQAALRHDMADALTNLGRRNQNLVSRQLDYITTIEKGETDPDKLDQLFKLDHLATRMRRNAESLLVLGGAESPRQWSAPVAVVDVVRSALAEVEDFRRVTLGSIAPVEVAGRSTSDLAHLIAELIENGLSYSPPHTEVRVDGSVHSDGYHLTITDRGLGMDADALTQANGRLSGDEAYQGSPSRYLGLYVTGQLASRHGVRVVLEPGTASGIVATVALPAELLAGAKVPGAPAPSAQAALAARVRPGTPEPTADVRAAALDAVAVANAEEHTRPSRPTSAAVAESRSRAGAPASERPAARRRASAPERSDDLLALLDPDEAKGRQRRSRRPEGAPAPVATAPAPLATASAPAPAAEAAQAPTQTLPPPPQAKPEDTFESWLDTRLEQLAHMSVEQAVTATAPRPVEPSGSAAGDGGSGGGGLPRRRPSAGDAAITGLRRRAAAPDETATGGDAPRGDAPRVSSSLFRYLSAVDQRTNDPTQEGNAR